MGVVKRDNGWDAFYCITKDGKKLRGHKRGFSTKKEALAWIESQKATVTAEKPITLNELWLDYEKDQSVRLKANTMANKRFQIQKILSRFGEMPITEITPRSIRDWQTDLINAGYAPTYLKAIQAQFSALINYGIRFHGIVENPILKAGSMGSRKTAEEMSYWTPEEFTRFIREVADKPASYYGFYTLFWTGIRLGELLALTPADFDFEKRTLRINKSYQRINGRDVITTPKTKKSIRTIPLPKFYCDKMQQYLSGIYGLDPDDRIFSYTKHFYEHEIRRGVKKSGVKRIRIHDLRHSHASLLISRLGASPQLVADRLGHENIQTTLNIYSHLYDDQPRQLADSLDKLMGSMNNEETDKNTEKQEE